MGDPQMDGLCFFLMGNPIKMGDLGVPLPQETSISCNLLTLEGPISNMQGGKTFSQSSGRN